MFDLWWKRVSNNDFVVIGRHFVSKMPHFASFDTLIYIYGKFLHQHDHPYNTAHDKSKLFVCGKTGFVLMSNVLRHM